MYRHGAVENDATDKDVGSLVVKKEMVSSEKRKDKEDAEDEKAARRLADLSFKGTI